MFAVIYSMTGSGNRKIYLVVRTADEFVSYDILADCDIHSITVV